MRISDWSSDVCSSDLAERVRQQRHILQVRQEGALGLVVGVADIVANLAALAGQFADARHGLRPRLKNWVKIFQVGVRTLPVKRGAQDRSEPGKARAYRLAGDSSSE